MRTLAICARSSPAAHRPSCLPSARFWTESDMMSYVATPLLPKVQCDRRIIFRHHVRHVHMPREGNQTPRILESSDENQLKVTLWIAHRSCSCPRCMGFGGLQSALCPDKPDRRVAGTAKSYRGVFCSHLECSSPRDDILGMVNLGTWDIAELPVKSYERTRRENKVRRLVPFLRNTDSTESRTAQTPDDAHPAEVTGISLLGWLND